MKTSKKKRAAPRAPAARVQCVDIILIDSSKLRKSIVAKYRKAESKLDQTRADIVLYETEDLSAYNQWEQKIFGPMLERLQKSSDELQANRAILERVDMEVFLTGCSRKVAYQRVLAGTLAKPTEEEVRAEEEANTEPDDDPSDFSRSKPPPVFDVDDYDRLSKSKQAKVRARYEAEAKMFHQFYGQYAPSFEELLEAARAGNRRVESAPQNTNTAKQFKTLYRRLVRLLHPDGNSAHGSRELDIWHDVQAAYQSGDLARLQAVAARYDLAVADQTDSVALGTIHDVIRDILRAVQELSRHLRYLKSQPAWRFSSTTDFERDHIRRKRRFQLEAQQEGVDSELEFSRYEIAKLRGAIITGSGKWKLKKVSAAFGGQGDFFL